MITIDIDTKNRATVLATHSKALKFGKTKATETTHGFHFRIDSEIEDHLEICRIRKLLGDDPKRIEHDMLLIELGHPELANRLFEWKKPLGSKKYVREKPIKMEELICRETKKEKCQASSTK